MQLTCTEMKNVTDNKIATCLTAYDGESNTLLYPMMLLYNTLCKRKCSVMLRQQNVMNDITTVQCSATLHLHANTVLT